MFVAACFKKTGTRVSMDTAPKTNAALPVAAGQANRNENGEMNEERE